MYDMARLAIETDSHHVIRQLVKTSQHDWEHSQPLDLTDEGIRADMEKHGAKGEERLAVATPAGSSHSRH